MPKSHSFKVPQRRQLVLLIGVLAIVAPVLVGAIVWGKNTAYAAETRKLCDVAVQEIYEVEKLASTSLAEAASVLETVGGFEVPVGSRTDAEQGEQIEAYSREWYSHGHEDASTYGAELVEAVIKGRNHLANDIPAHACIERDDAEELLTEVDKKQAAIDELGQASDSLLDGFEAFQKSETRRIAAEKVAAQEAAKELKEQQEALEQAALESYQYAEPTPVQEWTPTYDLPAETPSDWNSTPPEDHGNEGGSFQFTPPNHSDLGSCPTEMNCAI